MLAQQELKHITLFYGEKRKENETIIRLLEKLHKKKGVTFEIVNESLILKDTIMLPFIKTNTGEVHYKINSFIEKALQK